MNESGCCSQWWVILLRMNRSIQVQGVFGSIKEDHGFRRFLLRGRKNVLAEFLLMSLDHNMNMLHNKIQDSRYGNHLYEVKTAQTSEISHPEDLGCVRHV